MQAGQQQQQLRGSIPPPRFQQQPRQGFKGGEGNFGGNQQPRYQQPKQEADGGSGFAGRGAQGFQSHFNNSNFEVGSGSNQGFSGGWMDRQQQQQPFNNQGQQFFNSQGSQNFNNQEFSGEFGTFDEAYYEGGNGNQGINFRDFYFRALGSLVVLSFHQLLSFSSVLSKPLSETPTSAGTAGCPTGQQI
jgi:hypothetical protein